MDIKWNKEQLEKYILRFCNLVRKYPNNKEYQNTLARLYDILIYFYLTKENYEEIRYLIREMDGCLPKTNLVVKEPVEPVNELLASVKKNIKFFYLGKSQLHSLSFTKKNYYWLEDLFDENDYESLTGKCDLTEEELITYMTKYLDTFKSKKKLNNFRQFLKYNKNFIHISRDYNNYNEMLGECIWLTNKRALLWLNDYSNLVVLNTLCHEIEHVLNEYEYGKSKSNNNFSELSPLVNELYFTDFLKEQGFEEEQVLRLKKKNMMISIDIIGEFVFSYFQFENLLNKKGKLRTNAREVIEYYLSVFGYEKEQQMLGEEIKNSQYCFNTLLAYYIYYNFDKDDSVKEIDKLIRITNCNDYIYPNVSVIFNQMKNDLNIINSRLNQIKNQSKRAKMLTKDKNNDII